MNAYFYKADIYCRDCIEKVWNKENVKTDDDIPTGPYSDGGGEADSPQHCGSCGLFLENPLTEDGEEHVKKRVEEYKGNTGVLNQWREFYNYIGFANKV